MATDNDPIIGTTTNEDTLAALRDITGLHENMPQVTRVHPIAVMPGGTEGDSYAILCIHDDANETVYNLSYPTSEAKKFGSPEDVNEGVKHHVSRIVSAAWN